MSSQKELRDALESPAVRSLQKEKREKRNVTKKSDDERLTEALKESFPASDPPAATSPTTAGEGSKNKD